MINLRIKEVRESLNMSQDTFATALGLQRNSISLIENGKRNPSERTLNDISKIFNISFDWLRTGYGEMFVQPETFSLDDYARSKDLTALEMDIIRGYIELDSDVRKQLMDHFKSIFAKHTDVKAPDGLDIDQEVERYRRELEAEQKGETSSASAEQKENIG